MLANKLKNIKTASLGKFMYPAIFALYLAVLLIIFISTVKFLTETLNLAFAPAENQIITERFSSLNLADYALLADKLSLEYQAPIPPTVGQSDQSAGETAAETTKEEIPSIVTTGVIPSTAEPISSTATETPASIVMIASSSSVITSPTAQPINTITQDIGAPSAVPLNLKIAVINSTTKSGLAGELRTLLIAAGYPVAQIGNQSKTEENTLVKIKSGLDRTNPSLLEINKIVSTKYNFTVETLTAGSPYDLEIVIGLK